MTLTSTKSKQNAYSGTALHCRVTSRKQSASQLEDFSKWKPCSNSMWISWFEHGFGCLKHLLVDLTVASNSCVHRYLCKNISFEWKFLFQNMSTCANFAYLCPFAHTIFISSSGLSSGHKPGRAFLMEIAPVSIYLSIHQSGPSVCKHFLFSTFPPRPLDGFFKNFNDVFP